jgi:spore coat protein CotH
MYWRAVPGIHNLADDGGFQTLFYRLVHHKIDVAPEEIFEKKLTVHVMVENFFRKFPEMRSPVQTSHDFSGRLHRLLHLRFPGFSSGS